MGRIRETREFSKNSFSALITLLEEKEKDLVAISMRVECC